MFGCFLFKKFNKIHESCSLLKAARISLTYVNKNLVLSRLFSFKPLRFVKTLKKFAKGKSQTRNQG